MRALANICTSVRVLMKSFSGGSRGFWHTRAMRRSKSWRRLLLGGGSRRQLTCRASVATSRSCSRPVGGGGQDGSWIAGSWLCLKVRPRPPVLTEDVDKDFVQVERQQRFFEPLEVVPHRPEDVPLKAGVQLLPAVTAIRP